MFLLMYPSNLVMTEVEWHVVIAKLGWWRPCTVTETKYQAQHVHDFGREHCEKRLRDSLKGSVKVAFTVRMAEHGVPNPNQSIENVHLHGMESSPLRHHLLREEFPTNNKLLQTL